MLLNTSLLAGFSLAGIVEAGFNPVTTEAAPQAYASRIRQGTGTATASASGSATAANATRILTNDPPSITATVIGDGYSDNIAEAQPVLSTATVFGTTNQAIRFLTTQAQAQCSTAVEKIVYTTGVCESNASLQGGTTNFSLIAVQPPTHCRAYAHADVAVLSEGVYTVDFSSFVNISSAAVLNNIAYSYAINPSHGEAYPLASATKITYAQGYADCEASLPPAVSNFTQMMIPDDVVYATADLTGIARRKQFATGDHISAEATAQHFFVSYGLTTSAAAQATCAAAAQKIRIAQGEFFAQASLAAVPASLLFISGGTIAGIAVSTGYNRVNQYTNAPEGRMLRVDESDAEYVVEAEDFRVEII